MDWLSIAAAVLGIAGILGAAAAYFWSNRSKAIIELQEKEIAALEQSNTRLDKENAECRAMNDAKDQQLETMRGLVKQTPEIVKLVSSGKKQHEQVMKVLKNIEKKVK